MKSLALGRDQPCYEPPEAGHYGETLLLLYARRRCKVKTESYHVVPGPRHGWSVKRSGADRATRHFSNQEDAVLWARKLSKGRNVELIVHRRDGTVKSKDAFSGRR